MRHIIDIMAGVAIVVLLLVFANAVRAHSDGHMHYPSDCCSNVDCAPVEKVEIVPFSKAGLSYSPVPTVMLITTKHGSVLVPHNLARRESKDGRMHACISCLGGACKLREVVNKLTGTTELCLFMPPTL